MENSARKQVLLVDVLPSLGFHWVRHLGSPRIMRTNGRDEAIMKALIEIAGTNGKIHRPDVIKALGAVWDRLTELFRDATLGIKTQDKAMIQWLLRVKTDGGIPLASAIDDRTWVELVFRVVAARNKYKREVAKAQQDGDRPDLSELALAVDRFRDVSAVEWGHEVGTLYFYSEPGVLKDIPRWEAQPEVSKPEREKREEFEPVAKGGIDPFTQKEVKPVAKEEPKPVAKEEPKPANKEDAQPADKEEPKPLTAEEITALREAQWRYEIEHALDDEEKPEKDSDDSDSDGLEEGDEPDGDEQILDLLRYLEELRITRAVAAAAEARARARARARANQGSAAGEATDLNSE